MLSRILMAATLAGGFGAGWAAHAVKSATFDWPQQRAELQSAAEAQCALTHSQAAIEAERAERERQTKANKASTQLYRDALEANQLELEQANKRLETEIAKNEAQLRTANRYCGLSQSDIDFLYQRQPSGDR